MIHGSCCDYRAAGTVDLAHDRADRGRQVTCPALVLYGASGLMAQLFDLQAVWSPRLADLRTVALPGGHFFVDQHPHETAACLEQFLVQVEGR